MYDVQLALQAGIVKQTKGQLPGANVPLKADTLKALRILDEQNAVNRYTWNNALFGMSSQEIERLLYYKYQLYWFYYEPLKRFFLLPGALDGGIDLYGRYETIHPVPLAGGAISKDALKAQEELLSTLKLKVYYDFPDHELTQEEKLHACVPVFDYTKQMSQSGIPRAQLQEPLLDMMSDCLPLMRTALFNSTGQMTLPVESEDEAQNVRLANNAINASALGGQRFIPVISGNVLKSEVLSPASPAHAQEFLMAMQAQDNLRLGLLGLDNGGIFQKKAHMLEGEQEMNQGIAKSTLVDGFEIRQRACDIASTIWTTSTFITMSDAALGQPTIQGDFSTYDSQMNQESEETINE